MVKSMRERQEAVIRSKRERDQTVNWELGRGEGGKGDRIVSLEISDRDKTLKSCPMTGKVEEIGTT